LLTMDHDAFVARGHELINDRSFQGRNESVLDKLLVAERLLEFACFDLEHVPIVDVQVGILDPRLGKHSRALVVAKIGQQSKLVVFEHIRFDTEAGSTDQKCIDVGVIAAVQEGPVISLNLSRDSKLEVFVGRTNYEPFVLDPPGKYLAAGCWLPAIGGR